MLGPAGAAMMAGDQLSRALRGTNSGSNKSQGVSPLGSRRPTRTPPERADPAVSELAGIDQASAVVLTERDLAARHDVFLQDTGTIVMLEQPGRPVVHQQNLDFRLLKG